VFTLLGLGILVSGLPFAAARPRFSRSFAQAPTRVGAWFHFGFVQNGAWKESPDGNAIPGRASRVNAAERAKITALPDGVRRRQERSLGGRQAFSRHRRERLAQFNHSGHGQLMYPSPLPELWGSVDV